jgi:hypothetical protein
MAVRTVRCPAVAADAVEGAFVLSLWDALELGQVSTRRARERADASDTGDITGPNSELVTEVIA